MDGRRRWGAQDFARFPCSALRVTRVVHEDIERILLGESQIRAGIDRLAGELTADYRGADLTVVAVLKGSCVFVADLIRRLPIPLQLAFIWAESYRAGTVPGRLELFGLPPSEEIAGRSVLLVDDILDSGRTLAAVRAEILRHGAAEVRICVFLDKPVRRAVAIEPDYVCFELEDVFVVGYGLDHGGRYRNLPFVAALKPEVLAASVSARERAR